MRPYFSRFLFALLFPIALARLPATETNAESYFLYAGSFNRPTATTVSAAKGIYAWRFDPATGDAAPLGLVAETINAAHLAVSPDQKFLYVVNWATGEPSGDSLTAYAIDRKTGALVLINQVSSQGASPNQVMLDPSGRVALAVTFKGGTVAAFAVKPDGGLNEAFSVERAVVPEGSAASLASHPHGVAFSTDGNFVFVADLGLDRIYAYQLDAAQLSFRIGSPAFIALPAGSGPRRLQLSPDGRFLYAAHETNSQVSVYAVNRGELSFVQALPCAPAAFVGKNSPSEILISRDGRSLYVGNRGSDTVVWYSINPGTGRLVLGGHVSAGGKNPRNLGIDPTNHYLIVSNQGSDRLVFLPIDPVTGVPRSSDRYVEIVQPGGVAFAQVSRR